MSNDVKLKVYLETSFVSYLTGGVTLNAKIAADQAYTRIWWERERSEVEVFISGYTLAECEEGNATRAAERLGAIKDVPLLPDRSDEVVLLARKLIDGHALPEGETTDALHIAAAAVNGMDVLLTWNCKHMANPHTLPKTRQIIASSGFFCPAIMTPKTFIENTEMEVSHV
ncbi:MAG: type II toxin-antitoxin system VapC family toxin [Kiritimatiellae bacterium]|nr:type II toxin-antitoxin system VapC family toxin [Kiritimatiellia bacterium]